MSELMSKEKEVLNYIKERVPESVTADTLVNDLLSDEFDAIDFFTLIRDIEKEYDVQITTDMLGISGGGAMGETTIQEIVDEIQIQDVSNLSDAQINDRIRDAVDEILSEAKNLEEAGEILGMNSLSEVSRKILGHARRIDELAKRNS